VQLPFVAAKKIQRSGHGFESHFEFTALFIAITSWIHGESAQLIIEIIDLDFVQEEF
jgi:hypothetical protein